MKAVCKILSILTLSVSTFFLILCGVFGCAAFAEPAEITPHDYLRYAFLPHRDPLNQSAEYFRTPEFNTTKHFDDREREKITSFDVHTYKSPERIRQEEAVDFNKFSASNAVYKDSRGIHMLEPAKQSSDFTIDNLSLKRKNKYEIISEKTNYMAFLHIAAAGLLYFMPESVTKWDKSTMSVSTVTDKWVKDVKSGPVWDHDDWAINYIGHPYQGAAYYVFARQSGFEWKESFLFSTIISTFMWEYGFESFAEVPSTQDLIVTPIAGSILGEILLNGGKRIAENDGKVLGSKMLGDISMVLIDPAGSAVKAMQRLTSAPAKIKTRTEVFYEPAEIYNFRDKSGPLADTNTQYGLRVVFTYN